VEAWIKLSNDDSSQSKKGKEKYYEHTLPNCCWQLEAFNGQYLVDITFVLSLVVQYLPFVLVKNIDLCNQKNIKIFDKNKKKLNKYTSKQINLWPCKVILVLIK